MLKTICATNSNLRTLVLKEIEKHGRNCSLNHIDVSQVTDMSEFFFSSEFNGDISQWDTSKVEDMSSMFQNSLFNGDISQWNTGQVKDMSFIFANSAFNGDISQWDVSKVKGACYIFFESQFKGDLRLWNWNEKQMEAAFGESFPAYLEARRPILEHEKLKESFQSYHTAKKARTL